MLLLRQVYSSWYRLASAAIVPALSLPEMLETFRDIDSVDSIVPKRSNATTVLVMVDG